MRIIDADGHVLERDIKWADLLEEPYRSRAPKSVQDNRGFNFVMIDGKLTPKPVGKGCSFVGAPRNRNPQPTTGMTRSGPTSQGYGHRRHRHRGTLRDIAVSESAVCRRQRSRFAPSREFTTTGWRAIARPIRDGSRESRSRRSKILSKPSRSCVARLKNSNSSRWPRRPFRPRKKTSTIPDLYPFFAEAQRLNVPVCIHVGAGDGVPAGTERFDHPFYTHAMAHPFEQMIAVLCVVVGGLLERFPRLKVAFMEAGAGWVPYWMERLDEHYEFLQPTVPWRKETAQRIHAQRANVLCLRDGRKDTALRRRVRRRRAADLRHRLQS